MRIALYQPDIPQNTGTILRLAACLDIAVDIIRPAGFALTDSALRRAGLDYMEQAAIVQHESFEAFLAWRAGLTPPVPRLVLLSARAEVEYLDFSFAADDIVLAGRESAGVPEPVRDICDAAVKIPIRPGLRSLNVAVAVAMVVGEAVRQRNIAGG